MKICMVTIKFPPYFAGAAVQAIHLAHALKEKGVDVEFITDNDALPDVHGTYQGLKVFRFSTFFTKRSKIKELIYVIRIALFALQNRKRFDVFHFHSMLGFEAALFPFLTKILKKKVLLKLTLAGNDDPLTFKKRKMGPVYFSGISQANQFVAISSQLEKMALAAGIPQERISRIDNGVNTEKYFPVSEFEKKNQKAALGLSQYSKVFLSIGKIEERKGYDFLLEAWAFISKAFPGAALVIGGPGNDSSNPFYKKLLKIISDLKLQNVIFLGQIDGVQKYTQASDAFLFCSRAEGFGTVVVEAMACGVPVIASNIENITEDILDNTDISRICYSDLPEDFAAKVISFLNQADSQKVIAAAQSVRSRFDINTIANHYIDLYQSLQGAPATRIRVLHLIKTLNLGGAETNLLNLAKTHDPSKIEAHIGYSFGGELESQFLNAGFKLFKYSETPEKIKSPKTLWILLRLMAYIKKHKIDIVHTHNFNAHIWGVLAARSTRVKVVEHVHDHRYTGYNYLTTRKSMIPQFRHIERFKGWSNSIILLSHKHLERVIEGKFVKPENAFLIPNGLPLHKKVSDTFDSFVVKSLNIEPEDQIIFTASRLDEAKNTGLIFQIALQVLKSVPRALFVISGDGPLYKEYVLRAEAPEFKGRVRFIGFNRNTNSFLAASKIFLLPTLLELHSISILEALRMGIPVVTSKGTGYHDQFIKSGENGILLDPLEPEGWAEAIVSLLLNPEYRDSMAQNGHRTFEEQFDISHTVEKIQEVYEKLLQ